MSIGAGVILALFLLRVVGPHDPALDPPATTLRHVPGIGVQTVGGPFPESQSRWRSGRSRPVLP